MRSVSDLEDQAAALPRAAGTHDRAEGPRDAALPPDHLADVLLRHVEAEDEGVVPLLLLDANGVGIVHEPLGEVQEQLSQDS
jgi:hypothetical protein